MIVTPTIRISRCLPWDGVAIQSVIYETWLATYEPIMGLERAQKVVSQFSAPVMQWYIWGGWFGSGLSLKATSADKIVGYAQAKFEERGAVILYMLYVLPSHQGLGVGTQLLRAIEAHRSSTTSIRVETLRDNTSAIRWYKARGFEEYGSTPNASGISGVASIYMDKSLGRQA